MTSTSAIETSTSCTNILKQSRYHSLTLYLPNTEYVLILLFQLIIGFSIINNLLTIQTCFRQPIRITNLGLYLILLSFSNLIRCIFLETSLICDIQSLERTVLFHVSALSLNLLNFSAMWYSSMIACERLFIECFNCALDNVLVFFHLFYFYLFYLHKYLQSYYFLENFPRRQLFLL
jgi:hypothetical protein